MTSIFRLLWPHSDPISLDRPSLFRQIVILITRTEQTGRLQMFEISWNRRFHSPVHNTGSFGLFFATFGNDLGSNDLTFRSRHIGLQRSQIFRQIGSSAPETTDSQWISVVFSSNFTVRAACTKSFRDLFQLRGFKSEREIAFSRLCGLKIERLLAFFREIGLNCLEFRTVSLLWRIQPFDVTFS